MRGGPRCPARARIDSREDVRALLRVYHERTRDKLERLGGTVEKFIGDSVVAVFARPSRTTTTLRIAAELCLRSARGLADAGRLGESETQLELARAMYCKVGATAYLAEADAIVVAAG